MGLKKMSVWVLALVFAIISALTPVRAADEKKPVALLSLAGYDAQIGAIDTLADLLGQKETLGAMLMLLGETEGFDKSKPCGAVVLGDSNELFAFGFLPIADLDALECPGAEELRENYDSTTGLLTLSGDGDDAVRVKLTVRDGWCFFTAPGKETLLPEGDPAALLDELDKNALIAGKLFTDRIPLELLDSLVAPLRQQLANMDASQSGSFENGMKMLISALESTETVSFALTVDSTNGDTVFSFDTQVKPKTEMAALLEQTKTAKTRWLDFFRPSDSVFALCGVNFQTDEMIALAQENYKNSIDKVVETLETDLDDETQRQQVKKMLDDFGVFVNETVALKPGDGACSLTNDHLFILGGTIGGGDRLIAVLDGMKEYFAAEEDNISEMFGSIKINGTDYAGYKVSTVTISDELAGQFAELDPDLTGQTAAALLGVRSDALILIAGLDKKKVSEMFKTLADAPREQAPVNATVFVFSLKNVGVFLDNLLPNAEEGMAVFIQALKEGSADAVITVENQFEQNQATGRLIIRGEFFKLIGKAIEQTQAKETESSSETDSDSDDLFDSPKESL